MPMRWTMEVWDAVAQLLCTEAFGWPREFPRDEQLAEVKRRWALRQHILDVGQTVKTVDELQAALKADGTLDALG